MQSEIKRLVLEAYETRDEWANMSMDSPITSAWNDVTAKCVEADRTITHALALVVEWRTREYGINPRPVA